MIRAYDKDYLDDAMSCLGEAMDYASQAYGMDMDDFLELFIASGLADQFSLGVPRVISGMSGTELVMEVFSKARMERTFPAPRIDYDCSSAYWCGWILAYYQWYTLRSFREIQQFISMRDIEKLYPTLHESSEQKFVDTVNRIIQKKNPPTHLQVQRRICGYTQRELAEKSGINLRTLQQYENRSKDIGKAAGVTLLALSRVLGCRMEYLLEYTDKAEKTT